MVNCGALWEAALVFDSPDSVGADRGLHHVPSQLQAHMTFGVHGVLCSAFSAMYMVLGHGGSERESHPRPSPFS